MKLAENVAHQHVCPWHPSGFRANWFW